VKVGVADTASGNFHQRIARADDRHRDVLYDHRFPNLLDDGGLHGLPLSDSAKSCVLSALFVAMVMRILLLKAQDEVPREASGRGGDVR
jgi:hypothetical protein